MRNKWWKSWVWGVVGVGGVLIILFGSCSWTAFNLFRDLKDSGHKTQDTRYLKWCGGGLPFVQQIDKILKGTYIVLLQNNYELRPTGGFMGSYAVVNFENGLNVQVKDIYDTDGKLPGHVEPPYPIQEAFLQGWWKLRDANWAVDYPKAATDVNWFLKQGGENKVDGIIAVNMELFKKWLDVMKGVEVTTYGQKITAKNLYILAQREAEENFVPGSTQKRDFLGAVGTALLEKTKSGSVIELFKLTKLIRAELEIRQIMVWFKDKDLQKEAEKWQWDGSLPKLPVGVDYIYIVESNLGANKANCCIKREMNINEEGITITWKNENEFSEKKPPIFWGGDYYDYLRVVVNNPIIQLSSDPVISVDGKILRRATEKDFEKPNSLRKDISWDMYNVENYAGYQIIGFWVKTGAKKESVIKFSVNLLNRRGLMIDRQPGIEGFPVKVEYKNKVFFDKMVENREIIWLN